MKFPSLASFLTNFGKIPRGLNRNTFKRFFFSFRFQLIALALCAILPMTGMIVVETVYADVNLVPTHHIPLLIGVIVSTIATTWIVGEVFLLRDFNLLMVTVKRLQSGDLSARSGVTSARGEIRELLDVVDNMAEVLEWHDEEYKQNEEELRANEKRLHEVVEETRRAAARAEALVHTANLLNAQHNLEVVLSIICEETSTALNVPLVNISLYDEQRDVLYVAYHIGAPLEYRTLSTPTPRSMYDTFVEQMGTNIIVFPDVLAVSSLPDHPLHVKFNIRSAAGISMTREGNLIGVLGIATIGETRTFDESEIMLLQGLADQAAQAISNAQLFEESARRLQRTQALRQIDMAITASLDLRLIFDIVLEHTRLLLKVDAADVLVLRESGLLEFASGHGFRASETSHSRLRLGEGYVGQAVMERRTIHIRDLSRANDPPTTSHISAKENFVSYYCVPLIAKGKVKGVLEVFHRAPLTPDTEWLEFLETLAGQAAIAIDNITLFNKLQRSNAELSAAYETTLEGWSHALDLRDQATEGHALRVTEMTLTLAQLASVGETDLIHIRRGTLLHDIGKMGVPDSILLKPDKLNDEEWGIMRKHPQYAYELLSPIPYLRPALDIPYCHHEKWDGTGYPRGLKGEQIPFAARLFAIVDIWDALTSDRPYRAAWSKEKSLEHIKSLAGTHLDPRVVDLFLGIIA
ncbi:MAG: GAF domain-containing protein [Chloroflexi bacterium]|nr:GAF domain-containing protein [Chloroflexota bacterium]